MKLQEKRATDGDIDYDQARTVTCWQPAGNEAAMETDPVAGIFMLRNANMMQNTWSTYNSYSHENVQGPMYLLVSGQTPTSEGDPPAWLQSYSVSDFRST